MLLLVAILSLSSTQAAVLLSTDNATARVELSEDVDFFPIENQSYVIAINYTNTSSNISFSSSEGYCEVGFNGSDLNLTHNSSLGVFTDSFVMLEGSYPLSVNCDLQNVSGYQVVSQNFTNITVYPATLLEFVNQTTLGITDYLIPSVNFTVAVNLSNLSGIQNSTETPSFISDSGCVLHHASGILNLTPNGSLYRGRHQENTSGTFSYNVSCDEGANTTVNLSVESYHTEFEGHGTSLGNSPLESAVLLGHQQEELLVYTKITDFTGFNISSRSALYSNSSQLAYEGVLGLVDIERTGVSDVFFTGRFYSGSKIYKNSDYSFTALLGLPLIDNYQGARASLFDVDQDGDTDFIVSATSGRDTVYLSYNGSDFENTILFSSNSESVQCYLDADADTAFDLYYSATNGTRFAGIYTNQNGSFIPNTSVTPLTDGACTVGTLSNTSNPELLVMGKNASTISSQDDIVTLLYTGRDWSNPIDLSDQIHGLIKGSLIVADFDSDGLSDIIVCGENASSAAQTTYYHNEGNYTFTREDVFNSSLQVSSCSLSASDYDSDGDLDLALAGVGGSNPIILLNNTFTQFIVNEPPSAPSELGVQYNQSTKELFLNWSKGSDAISTPETLSYNIEVEDALGNLLISRKYPVSSHPVQGYLGNMQYRTHYKLYHVEPSNFIVRVQAIDNGYQHSNFTEASYTLSECEFPQNGTLTISGITCVLDKDLSSNATINVSNNGSLRVTENVLIGGDFSVYAQNGTVVIGAVAVNASNLTIQISADSSLEIASSASLSNTSLTLFSNTSLKNISFTNGIIVANKSTVVLNDVSGVAYSVDEGTVADQRKISYNITNSLNESLNVQLSNGSSLSVSQLYLYRFVNVSLNFTPAHEVNISAPFYYEVADSFTAFEGIRNITLNQAPLPDTTAFDTGTNFSALLSGNQSEDFTNFSNLTDVTVGLTQAGEITFLESLNVTGINFSEHVSIKQNFVSVNSSAEARLNVSTNIRLRNLSYTQQPLIYKDGSICENCSNVSYNTTSVSFIVPGFSNLTTSVNSNLSSLNSTQFIINQSSSISIQYLNLTNQSQAISDATCFLTSDNGYYTNSALTYSVGEGYIGDLNLSTLGTVGVEVFCNSSASFEPLRVNTSVFVFDVGVQYYLTQNLSGVAESGIAVYENGSFVYAGSTFNKSLISSVSYLTPLDFSSIQIADLNNDGIEDVVSQGLSSAGATLRYRLGGSGIEVELDKQYKGDLAVFDFDADGDSDIISCGLSATNTTRTVLYRNTLADSGFTTLGFSSIEHNLSNVSDCSIEVWDFDSDGWGDLTLFGVGENDSKLGEYYINLNGVFLLNQTLLELGESSSVFWDYDLDGDRDVVVNGKNESLVWETVVFTYNNNFTLNNTLSNQLINKENAILTKALVGTEEQLIISATFGNETVQSVFFNGTDFINTSAGAYITPAQIGAAEQADLNNDSQPEFIWTGKTDSSVITHVYTSTAQLHDQTHQKPQIPNISASYDSALQLNFTNASEVIYRVGNLANPNAYISGAQGSEIHTISTNKTYTTPAHCLIIQAKAVNHTIRSEWSNAVVLNNRTEVANNNIDEDCDGVRQFTSSSTSTSSTSNSASFVYQVTEQINQESSQTGEEEVDTRLPKPESNTGSSNVPDIITKQVKEFEQRFEVSYVGSKTKIVERIKNIERTPKQQVVLRKTFPKAVLEAASTLNSPNNLEIIIEDPVLDFYLGDLDYLEEKTIVYTLPQRRTLSQLAEVESQFRAEQTLSNNEIQQKEQEKQAIASAALEVEFSENQTDNGTIYTIKLDLEDNVSQVNLVEVEQVIPKCILEEINEQILEQAIDPEFIDSVEIKEADPIIVWNLKQVDRHQELQLRLDGFREEDCEDEFGVKVLASSLLNKNTKINSSDLIKSYVLIAGVFISLFLILYLALREERYHEKPHIHRLVKQIIKRIHKAQTREQIEYDLLCNGETHEDIQEAYSHLNDNPNIHKKHKLLQHLGEIVIFLFLLVISFLELFFGVAGEWDLMKKIVSFVLMLYILYKASPVEMVFGKKHHGVSIMLLAGMFIMHLKNLIPFADTALTESVGFVRSFYLHLLQHEVAFNIAVFWIGISLVFIASLYASFRIPMRDGGIGYLIAHQEITRKKLLKYTGRGLWVFALYMVFFVTVFNRFMEWLAVAIDAVVYVLAALFFLIHLLDVMHRKHAKHGFHKIMNVIAHQWVIVSVITLLAVILFKELLALPSWVIFIPIGGVIISGVLALLKHKGHKIQDIEQISGLSDTFYLRCAKLFKHPVTLPLGILLLFTMQTAVEIALYIVSNLTGHVSHLYQSHTEQTLFSLFSDSGIIAQHLIELSGIQKLTMGLYYLMSISGYLLLFLIPLFLFALYYTNRQYHVSRLQLTRAVFKNHGWMKGMGELLIIAGIPLILISLTSGIFQIEGIGHAKSITSVENVGVSITAHAVTYSPELISWIVLGAITLMALFSFILRSKKLRNSFLLCSVWGGVGTLITIYLIPYYTSVISGLVDQLRVLSNIWNSSTSLAIVNTIQLIFNIADFGVVYVLGASVFLILLIPHKFRQKIVNVSLRILPSFLRDEFSSDLHYLHYYKDAKEHDSGNILHHLENFITHERKAGYSDEQLKQYILGHGYPEWVVEKVIQ